MAHGVSNPRKRGWGKRQGDLAPLDHMTKSNFLKGNERQLPEHEAFNTWNAPVVYGTCVVTE